MLLKKSFYFVRHGETDHNRNYLCAGSQTDVPLNKTGRLQAQSLREKIRTLPINEVICSPLKRTLQTAVLSTCLILGLESPILSMDTGEGSKNYPGPTQTFCLSDRRLNQEACRVLVNLPVSGIVLEGCHLGPPEARILAQAAHLRELNLADNEIGPEGAEAIATGNLTALTSLSLGSNDIGVRGARAISSANFSGLTFLNLEDNGIGDEGATAIAGGNLRALLSLYLGGNGIGVEGARAMANGNLATLNLLSLIGNCIRAEGTIALTTGNLAALESLNVSKNAIGDEGAMAIASRLTNLVSLNLEDNGIGDEGAMALHNTPFPRLTFLNLSFNRIGNDVKYSFKKSKPIGKLLL